MNDWNSGRLKIFSSKSFILDVRLRSEYASGSVNYFCQKLHLKPRIGLWICQFLTEISKVCYEETQNNSNKHVPFVPRNSCSKIFKNFDFGWQIINWAACSLTPIFMNTCIFRSLEIALLYYHFCYCNLWLHTNKSRTYYKLEVYSSLLTCSLAKFFLQHGMFNNCCYFCDRCAFHQWFDRMIELLFK